MLHISLQNHQDPPMERDNSDEVVVVGNQKSSVWDYYTRNPNPTIRTCVCNICGKVKGIQSASPTENLKKHLKSVHQISFPEKDASVPRPQSLKRTRQSDLSGFVVPTKITKTEKATHDRRLAMMVCETHSPFTLVEHQSFIDYSQGLKRSYTPPTSATLSRSLIPDIARTVHQNVNLSVEEAEYSCVTTDGWKSNVGDSYIATTAHYIDKSWMLESACIGVDGLENGDANGYASKIEEFLDRYPHLKSTVVGFVADNTATMPAAAGILGFDFYGCFPHATNLVIQTGFACSEFEAILKKMRNVRKVFKYSDPVAKEFAKVQKQLRLPPNKLKKDSKVRWGSGKFMASRYMEQNAAVLVNTNLSLNFSRHLKFILVLISNYS